MSDAQLTRLADFTSGAGFMIIVFAILTSPRWWLVGAALLLMIIAIVSHFIQYRRAQSKKSN